MDRILALPEIPDRISIFLCSTNSFIVYEVNLLNMLTVNQTFRKIKNMEIRGALDIAIASAGTLLGVVNSGARDTKCLVAKLNFAGKKLKSARPTAVSLPNSVDYILAIANKNRDLSVDEFRERVPPEIKKFIEEQKNAVEKIAEIGSRLIENDDVILTHCNSDTVTMMLKRAWDDGNRINVICTETRPRYQGHITVRELSNHGIPTTLIIDSAVHYSMRKLKVDKVLVGADAISVSGDLINKIGTSQIALCAEELDIDFIVATESIKLSPKSIIGAVIEIEERSPREITGSRKFWNVRILNPAFDVTDARYIDMIVTEYGIIPPQAVYNILKEKFGWELMKK